MGRVTRRRVWRVALVILLSLVCSAYDKSCGTDFDSTHELISGHEVAQYIADHVEDGVDFELVPFDPDDPSTDFLLNDEGGSTMSVRLARVLAGGNLSDLDSAFDGRFALPIVKGKDRATFRYLAKGTITRGYALVSGSLSHVHVAATALVRFSAPGAGTACLSTTLTVTHDAQEAAGTFTFLGGTGRAARVYGSGDAAGVDPTGQSAGLVAAFGFAPRLGKARGVPSSCGKPPKTKPPTAKTVTASYAGFAVSTSAPSSSTKLTLADGTITSCASGGHLYGVLDYSGPSHTAAEGAAFGGSSSGSFDQPLTQGRNVIKILGRPGRGTYQIKTGIESTDGASLQGTTTLLPEITISC